VARTLALNGAKVAILSRHAGNLEQARQVLAGQGVTVLPVQADLGDAAQAERAVAEVEAGLGPVDILVNSAGAARRHEPEDLDPVRWREALDAKFFPYIHVQHAVLARLRARARRLEGVARQPDTGTIVNIIGVGGKQPTSTHLAGGSANAALMLSTVGLAAHYARYGIRINAVNPGFTLTERVQQAIGLDAARLGISEQQALEQGQARVPLGRYADPDEVAEVVLFLAGPRSSYVVGAVVPVDGGNGPLI